MKNWFWLIAAAACLYNAIVVLVQGNWQASLASFLLALVFGYAGFK
jgi:hypothetical protein